MMRTKANERLKESGGKSTREGAKTGVGRHERMKRDRGTNDRDERSRGIEIHISDAFAMTRPTSPFKLTRHTALMKRNLFDSSSSSLVKTDDSRWPC